MSILILIALPFLAYWPVRHGELVFDDDALDTHPLIKEGRWVAMFRWSHWRQITLASYALNVRVCGHNRWGFHAVNLGAHVLTVVLLWRVLA